MGKLGACELNFSSDIDLIVFFDPDAPACAPALEAQRLLRAADARLVRILQDRTGDGYVFRTDLRLRPDPGSTPLAHLGRRGAHLLRERRPELGARRPDQGAARGRRHRGGGAPSSPSSRPTSGANTWTSRRSPTSIRSSARSMPINGPGEHRGRRPQRQARPRRHPRDRVLRADPAADRRRPPPELRGRETLAMLAALAGSAAGSPPRRATS